MDANGLSTVPSSASESSGPTKIICGLSRGDSVGSGESVRISVAVSVSVLVAITVGMSADSVESCRLVSDGNPGYPAQPAIPLTAEVPTNSRSRRREIAGPAVIGLTRQGHSDSCDKCWPVNALRCRQGALLEGIMEDSRVECSAMIVSVTEKESVVALRGWIQQSVR